MGRTYVMNMLANIDDIKRRTYEERTGNKRKAEDILQSSRGKTLPISPHTPGHVSWADTLSRARSTQWPDQRLSVPEKKRSAERICILENSVQYVQCFIRHFERNAKKANQDFGDLIDYLGRRISQYNVNNPAAVDSQFRHLMSLGRMMRNSPSHVRSQGDERLPWDNDFILTTRMSTHVLLLTKLHEIDSLGSDVQEERVRFVKNKLQTYCMLAGLTCAGRVSRADVESEINNVHRPELSDTLAIVDTFSEISWTVFCPVIDRLIADLELELEGFLDRRLGIVVASGQTLPALLQDLSRVRKRADQKMQLNGGVNGNNLAEIARFAYQERQRSLPEDSINMPWAMHLVGGLLEHLIAVGTDTHRLRRNFESWECMLHLFLAEIDLAIVEDKLLHEDEEWKARRARARESYDDESEDEVRNVALEDPFRPPRRLAELGSDPPSLLSVGSLSKTFAKTTSKSRSLPSDSKTTRTPAERVPEIRNLKSEEIDPKVEQMLKELSLTKFRDLIAQNDINFAALKLLSADDYKELGFSIGARVLIMNYLSKSSQDKST